MPVAKIRQSSNPVDNATISINEKILRECATLYSDPERGLIKVAEQFGLTLVAPRKKIVIMLIGNHSAGKSSFINWYIEEHVQRTGVAIETKGFTIVTSGKKRDSLLGNATLHLFPHFKPISQFKGVTDFLSTEVSTSKQKKFSLVSFVDTPGLVDGDLNYPFDVQGALQWLGSMADLVFVFFDPIGQALCKRTLNVVEALNNKHAEKMRFYLSKADEAGTESDRQKVMMQIVQELCKRPSLNCTAFDMPAIYIPDVYKDRQPAKCDNQINEVLKDIEQTINHTIQNTLDTLEKDCEHINKLLDHHLLTDNAALQKNRKATSRVLILGLIAFLLPCLFVYKYLLTRLNISTSALEIVYDLSLGILSSAKSESDLTKEESPWTVGAIVVGVSLLLVLLARISFSYDPTLSRSQRKYFTELKNYMHSVVKKKKSQLYQEYLEQSVDHYDL
ncbi:sarcalumenin-like isoform X2 [Hetaerina americana]|uniref:sarcalumenin-like isoform X2 n=1 Tax=Hetaerina americana TaxID=62018 RepID=UPI003A7F1E4C